MYERSERQSANHAVKGKINSFDAFVSRKEDLPYDQEFRISRRGWAATILHGFHALLYYRISLCWSLANAAIGGLSIPSEGPKITKDLTLRKSFLPTGVCEWTTPGRRSVGIHRDAELFCNPQGAWGQDMAKEQTRPSGMCCVLYSDWRRMLTFANLCQGMK